MQRPSLIAKKRTNISFKKFSGKSAPAIKFQFDHIIRLNYNNIDRVSPTSVLNVCN